ncbi:hypothetical protein JB92DRAFT_2833159 [Gautieria morchelliformis]|nr:hypothetical protein JB92DRAFT_2833159 [Gautieria morchelliformis]
MVWLRGTSLRLKNFPITLIGGNGDAITAPVMQHLWSIVTRTIFGMFVTAVDWTAPLEGPDSILLDEIEAGFGELERQGAGLSIIDPELDRNEITAAQVYDLEALNGVDQGQAPQAYKEDIHMH